MADILHVTKIISLLKASSKMKKIIIILSLYGNYCISVTDRLLNIKLKIINKSHKSLKSS